MKPALVGLLGLLGLLAACNPYDPNLGPSPFLCGTDEPRCPDGYAPVQVEMIRCECLQSSGTIDAGAAYTCKPDTNEPNDDYHAPTVSHIGENSVDNFSNISLCPDGDLDHYGLTAPVDDTLIQATVTFDTTRATPDIDFLDSAGVSLHPTVTSQPGQLAATYTAPQNGIYVVRLSATQTVNYSLRLQIFLPAAR